MTSLSPRKVLAASLILLFLGLPLATAQQPTPQPLTAAQILFPPGIHLHFDGTHGAHNWFTSTVNFSITLDNGTIVHWIFISLDNGSFVPYTAPIAIIKEGASYLSIDIADENYTEYRENYTVSIDKTPPTITLSKKKIASRYTFTADAQDTTSGMWRVEFRLDNVLQKNVTAPPYTWTWQGTGHHTVTATAFDMAGNTAVASKTTPLSYPGGRHPFLHDLIMKILTMLHNRLG
jgi:hypothetical protein